jgi:hypothetical protein
VRDHTLSRACASVRGGGCVVEISGAADVAEEDVVADELVVASAIVVEVDVGPEVVGCSGSDDEAAPAQPVTASRDAQTPATAGRRSTYQYGTPGPDVWGHPG